MVSIIIVGQLVNRASNLGENTLFMKTMEPFDALNMENILDFHLVHSNLHFFHS